MRSTILLFVALNIATPVVEGFLPQISQPLTAFVTPSSRTAVFSKPHDDAPIECYITNEEEVVTDGEAPQVVCTSEPEEYAWFNGIDPDKMKKTDGMEEGKLECVEGSSPRGVEEWECKDGN